MTNRLRSFAVINHPGTPVPPESSASIDLADTERGFLPNRLTTDQRDAIADPPEGLTIYNTDTQTHELFDGSAWQQMAKSGGGGPTPYLQIANNLSDVGDVTTSRNSLGLGSAATHSADDFISIGSRLNLDQNVGHVGTATGGAMLGLGNPFTPTTTGNLLVILSGNVVMSTAGDNANLFITKGTGTPPALNDAPVGDTIGGPASLHAVVNGESKTFCLSGYISVVPNTEIWIDLTFYLPASTASLSNQHLVVIEL